MQRQFDLRLTDSECRGLVSHTCSLWLSISDSHGLRCYVFRLSVSLSDSPERDIWVMSWGNFFTFGTNVRFYSRMNWFDVGGHNSGTEWQIVPIFPVAYSCEVVILVSSYVWHNCDWMWDSSSETLRPMASHWTDGSDWCTDDVDGANCQKVQIHFPQYTWHHHSLLWHHANHLLFNSFKMNMQPWSAVSSLECKILLTPLDLWLQW